MDNDDGHDAERHLAEAEEGLRRGADAASTRPPRWYLVLTCGLAVAVGAANDIPVRGWNPGWFLREAVIVGTLLVWVAISRAVWWRGRPLPKVLGARVAVMFFVGLAVLYGLATIAGLGLRAAGAPLPFALAGLLFGVVLVAAIVILERPVLAAYRDRVAKGHW